MSSDIASPTIPKPLTRFVGRTEEIESILELLNRDDVRLLTLTGAGGIGKTRLAIEVAHNVAEQASCGVTFVALAPVANAGDALALIAGELGLWNAERADAITRLASLIDTEPALLVLDNLEHVIDIAPELGRLLSETSNLTILATSRSPLHIQGEREYSVPQLTTPDRERGGDLEDSLRSDAVALFVDRARSINHDFEIGDDNADAIAGICAELEGLPLAIELAAARIRSLPPAALLARLDNQLGLLRSEARDVPERLRTIRATIDWSYRLLTEREQLAFRTLSVFAGDFPLDAAEIALEVDEFEALDTIESLIDKSLLLNRTPTNNQPHFRMISVIREFGLEMLEAAGELQAIRERQAVWAARFAESHFHAQFGPEQRNAFREIDRVHESIRQALIWSMDNERWDYAARIAANLWQYWDLFGYLSQGRRWLRQIIDHYPDAPVEIAPNLYYAFGILAGTSEDADENQRIGTAILELSRNDTDQRLKGVAHNLLGLTRDPESALSSSRQAADIWKQTGDTIWHGLANGLAGRWARELGDLEMSDEYSRKSYDVLNEAGHIWGAALALLGIGRVHQLRGEIDQAETIYRRGLEDLVSIGDRILVLRYIEFMIDLATSRGDWRKAVRLSASADRMRETMGYALRYQGEVELTRLFRENARAHLGSEAFENEWAAGSRLSLEQSISEATERSAELPSARPAATGSPFSGILTRREIEVLEQVVAGKTDQMIADELFVSYRTVTTHVTNILNKLGANSRTEAAAIAVREKLIGS